jgi:hypothetical protein
MIEILFHRMKHRYLFIFLLANFESLAKGTDFYLEESNTSIPQFLFEGAAPEEIIAVIWSG